MGLLIGREKEIMVGELRVFAVEPKLQHETRAGRLISVECAHEGLVLEQEFLVRWNHLHVGNHDVGSMKLAIRDDAGDAAVFFAHLANLAVEVHGDAELVHQAAESERDAIEPAVDIPEIVAKLDRRHAVHECRGMQRRRSDILDEIIEDVAHVTGLEMPCDATVHRTEQVEFEKFSETVKFTECRRGIEPLLEITLIHQIIEVGRVLEKFFHICRILAHLASFGCHHRRVRIEIDHLAILEKISPMRAQCADRNVVRHFLSRSFKKTLKNVRQREDRRAQIKCVAFGLEHIQLAANLRVFLVNRDLVSFLRQ